MSLRQVRKLRGTRLDPLSEGKDSSPWSASEFASSDESLSGVVSFARPAKKSAFLLARGSSSEDDSPAEESDSSSVAGEEERLGEPKAPEEGEREEADSAEAAEGAALVQSGEDVREASVSRPEGQLTTSASGKKKKRKKKTQGSSPSAAPAASGKLSATEQRSVHEYEDDAMFASSGRNYLEEDGARPHESVAGTRYCLAMERTMFDTENELRRIFGREVTRNINNTTRSGSRRPDPVSRRRCWLLPDAADAAGTQEYLRMVREDDEASGTPEFALQYTPYYEQLQQTFNAIVHSYDPQNLQEFLLRHPRHVDALLQMSEVFRLRGNNETATELLKKALGVIQKAFHPAFSPFTCTAEGLPQVAVDSLNPFNKNLVKSIGLYAEALADQGCYRTALEVAKLLLAMDLPRDAFHIMLHLDYLALRSRQWQFLLHFSRSFVEQHLTYVIPLEAPGESSSQAKGEAKVLGQVEGLQLTDLALMLPNFAFSTALAIFLHGESGTSSGSIKSTTADDLLAICVSSRKRGHVINEGHIHHLLLMRAILLFPSFVRKLLQKLSVNGAQKVAGSPYASLSWEDLLFTSPLWDSAKFAHHRYSDVLTVLVSCYVQKTHDLWRADVVIRWLHGCTAHLRHLYSSCPEIKEFAQRWSQSSFLFDANRYNDVKVSEFDRVPTLPGFLLDAYEVARDGAARNRNRRVQYVSMNSSPIIVFFETLLPWTELDRTGLRAEPRHVVDVARSVFSVLCDLTTATWEVMRSLSCFVGRILVKGSSRVLSVPRSQENSHGGEQPHLTGR
ncbi:hypothetical protein BESB_019960 [Besnoitia besnoiti]|uniref:Transcriptional repressor TCF25 n=1 Tax=Besnoitia besnoiti TaxID=94643 RepID=A0A2A9M241_BESBE|nr:hypothetical protein BESB_019960 [Besnoitia besnoiti]PFH32055.1 hypothetical protein BESB_019960 [Besnoitia besnoiti]